MFKRILVALDGSESSWEALAVALDIAKRYGAELHSISVEEHLPHYGATVGEVVEAKEEENRHFARIAEEAKSRATAAGGALECHVIPGHRVETITEFARERGVDLIVLGHKTRAGFFSMLWDTTARIATRFAPCSVLVVK